VREDVEPAAVGHAHDDFLHAELGAVLDQRVEQRDERFAALDAEPLLPDVARVEEAFELLGGDELEEDRAALVRGELRLVEDRLHARS
jgi:hypothetical protein